MPAGSLGERLLDAVLPASCVGCDAPGPLFCPSCRVSLAATPKVSWPRPSPAGLPTPCVVAGYDGAVRRALLAYKERGVGSLAIPLGEALAAAVAAVLALASPPRLAAWLLPMPSSSSAVRQRGDDVMLRLARQAARLLRIAGVDARASPALLQRRVVADSSGLSAAQRLANLSGALALSPAAVSRSLGRPLILVDDLITTGATLAEAARVCRAAGLQPVGAATIAATTRRSPGAVANPSGGN